MTEPMIPVPESLIETYINSSDAERWPELAAMFRALLSQSTLTADPEQWANGHRWPCTRFYTSATERDQCTCDAITAPPSIADMAPGTTFTAEFDGERDMFFRCKDSVARAGRYLVAMDAIDPSTIRDVSPPEEQS